MPLSWRSKTFKTKFARKYITACDLRENAGKIPFGDYNPETDKRYMSTETVEEIEDAGVYQRFYRRKWRSNEAWVNRSIKITNYLFLAWVLAKEQEQDELEPTRSQGGGA